MSMLSLILRKISSATATATSKSAATGRLPILISIFRKILWQRFWLSYVKHTFNKLSFIVLFNLKQNNHWSYNKTLKPLASADPWPLKFYERMLLVSPNIEICLTTGCFINSVMKIIFLMIKDFCILKERYWQHYPSTFNTLKVL